MLTNAPKGTKDMMPDQAYKWHYIEEAFAEICRTYGFEEIRTPVFEHTELFHARRGRHDGYRPEGNVFLPGLRQTEHYAEAGRDFAGGAGVCGTQDVSQDRSRPSFTITRRVSAMRSRSQED